MFRFLFNLFKRRQKKIDYWENNNMKIKPIEDDDVRGYEISCSRHLSHEEMLKLIKDLGMFNEEDTDE